MNRGYLNLALQGGGSHGAFAWGVLDRLLQEGTINFEGISGTAPAPLTPLCSPTVLPLAVATAQGPRYEGIGKEYPMFGLGDHSNFP